MFKQIFRVMILLLCIFCLASCNKDNHIHSFTEEVVEPSCNKEGYVKITCECGYCSEEVIEKLPHHFVEGKCTCGEVEIIKVSVVNGDITNTIDIAYGSKINPQNYDFLQIDDEFFKAWCNGDEIFSFETLITDEITLTPKYYDKVTVTFVDENGEVLETKQIIKGSNAHTDIVPNKDAFEFIGWDKDLNNIFEDTTFVAQYEIIQKVYEIKYIIDESMLQYETKSDMVNDFLNDFYNFVNPDISYRAFIYGIEGQPGAWTNYIGGSQGANNYLIYNNDIEANNDDYFLNSSLYKEKWYVLSSYVRNKICASNKRFGYSNVEYYYGALDFYRYIIDDPAQYIDIYGGSDIFHGFPQTEINLRTSYEYLEENVTLYIPFNKSFDGWYKDATFTDGPYTEIEKGTYGDITFYAKSKSSSTYKISFDTQSDVEIDPIYVAKNEKVSLPYAEKDNCDFKGWYIDYEKFESGFEYTYDCDITLTAKWDNIDEVDYNYIVYNGQTITYRNSFIPVKIPDTYEEKEEELRACWVSSFVNNFSPSPNPDEMMQELTYVLDTFEEFNLNCMIFHLRTHNNAFYQTELAPIDSDYGTYESFNEWDYLTWLIEECHKRGIEFHAWLNPYRIATYGISNDATLSDVASDYVDYPLNPASNPDNILLTYNNSSSQGAILNPAKEEVQDYIVDVCLELASKYDIDAIHFDDYFYQKLTYDSLILQEYDQSDYILYIQNNPGTFSASSETDKENWRRMNVNNMIYKLHTALDDFNKKNNTDIILGISPTATYRSGDGSVETGSNTGGGGHYDKYLYCDTVKWINEDWIDYIMPQCYTSFDYKNFSFHEITSWWNKVVENKECQLYIGMGIYNSLDYEYQYSWRTQPDELFNQLLYLSTLENVRGVSLYSFRSLDSINNNSHAVAYGNLAILKEVLWTSRPDIPYKKKK